MKTQTTNKILRSAILTFTIISGVIIRSYSQQQTTFAQYMFNSLAINPAYAGYSGGGESLEITALALQQWLGIDGAPSTQTLSAHSPIRKTNMGIGLQISHDKIGPTREFGSYFSYSYHIPITGKRFNGKTFRGGSKIALGLQAGLSHFSNEFTSLHVNAQQDNQIDPNFASNGNNKLLFNFGAGIFYYNEKLYVGFSVPYILNNSFGAGSKQARHMFLTGGYLFDVTPSIKIKPSILVKMVSGAPVQLDLNANVLIKNLLWIGASWRSMASVNIMAEYQISPRIRLGYAYDIPTSELNQISGGAHEFRFNYRIPLGDIKIINPRCF